MEATILNHPLINHKLSILRDKRTGTKEFREIVGEISQILCYECMKDAELTEKQIETPICETTGYFIDEDKYAFVPILRAGTGMLDGLLAVVLDPMLATGGSGSDAITMLKDSGAKKIKFLCIIAAPQGIKKIQEDHPDVEIYCAALDKELNDVGYIVPGLGDAGDRIFGTK